VNRQCHCDEPGIAARDLQMPAQNRQHLGRGRRGANRVFAQDGDSEGGEPCSGRSLSLGLKRVRSSRNPLHEAGLPLKDVIHGKEYKCATRADSKD
jgi:hypothetical protein